MRKRCPLFGARRPTKSKFVAAVAVIAQHFRVGCDFEEIFDVVEGRNDCAAAGIGSQFRQISRLNGESAK